MPRRTKWTATELMDSRVYAIYDRCYLAKAADLDGEDPETHPGIFDGLLVEHFSIEDIDRAKVPGWVRDLTSSEANLRVMRKQLEALLAVRICPSCGSGVAGRADRIYCSTRCRVAAHRKLNLGEL